MKPERNRMLLKGNGVTRKQVENQIGEGETSPAEPWEQAGISEGRNAEPAAYLGPKSRRLWGLQGKPEEKRRI